MVRRVSEVYSGPEDKDNDENEEDEEEEEEDGEQMGMDREAIPGPGGVTNEERRALQKMDVPSRGSRRKNGEKGADGENDNG
jgi:hypothetical protein